MNILANLKIGKRLALGFSVILLVAIAIICIAVWRLQGVTDATKAMMQRPLEKERLISDWYPVVQTSILRVTAIAKSTDPALAPFFAKEDAAYPGNRARAGLVQEDRTAASALRRGARPDAQGQGGR